jgi:hypothetical protein
MVFKEKQIMKPMIYAVIVFIVSAMGFAWTDAAPAAQDDKLVLYLKFDEKDGAKAVDSSGQKNDGTVYGNAKWVAGKKGNALEFDGVTTVVKIPGTPALQLSREMTVAFWMKPEEAEDNSRFLVGKFLGNGQIREYGVILTPDDGVTVNSIDYNNAAATQMNTSTEPVDLGEWHHVVVIISSKATSVYINGKLANRCDAPAKLASPTETPLILGSSSYTGFYKGLLDEVRIYKRVLTESEIQALMK